MKKLQYILTGICSLALMTSCLKDYQDLNTNPEQLGDVDPRNAFTGATLNFNNASRGHLTGLYSGVMVYMQYLVGNGGASTGNYITLSVANSRPAPSNPNYSDYFNTSTEGGAYGLRLDNLLRNCIPAQENPEAYNDLAAITNIVLTYKQWLVLDAYGAAPLTEAFMVEDGVIQPRYDLYQKSIDGTPMYEVLDQKVKDAVAQLRASDASQVNLGSNDFFYKGNVQNWIKFGNTLRVKMAQRLEKADKSFYDKVLGEVLTSASNIIGAQEESFIYWHHRDYNDNIDDIHAVGTSYSASAALVNFLTTYNDPRLPLMVRRNGFGEANNNASNDNLFKTFTTDYPDMKVTYEVADESGAKYDSIMDFTPYTVRYIGQSANPANASKEPTRYGSNFASIKYIQRDEDGNPRIDDETGEVMTSTMSIRTISQFEGRYFVNNAGSRGNSNINVRDVEDAEYMVNNQSLQTFTPLLTYPETCFMMAEIAVKGGPSAGKSATQWFQEGIRASMEQVRTWAKNRYVVPESFPEAKYYNPLTDDKIAAYLARPEFQTATLEKIISQQWVNLFMQGHEMWATWKRTGLPSFNADGKPTDGVAHFENLINNYDDNTTLIIPRRNSLSMPNSLNEENWKAAVEELKKDAKYGTDFDRTEGRIWWDVE